MKIVKSLIFLAAFLTMAAIIINIVFLLDLNVSSPYISYKNAGAYVGVAAMAVLLIALMFIHLTEKKMRKLQRKIEEKDQEIGRLQKSLEQSNDVINIVPSKNDDVEM